MEALAIRKCCNLFWNTKQTIVYMDSNYNIFISAHAFTYIFIVVQGIDSLLTMYDKLQLRSFGFKVF